MPLVLAACATFVAGAIVGSFLNVVIHRVPAGASIVTPRSRCPHCDTSIKAIDNIPLMSWLLLRGRCRECQAPISVRYPLVEAATGLAWVGVIAWAWAGADRWALVPLLLVLVSAGIALAVIDVEHHRLPDPIVLWLYPVTVVGLALAGVLTGSWPVPEAGIGAAAWLVVIGGIWLVTRGAGMGLGDVKLAPVLGATLGWISLGSAIVGLATAFILAAAVAVILLLTRRVHRRTAVAFGPFMLAGAALGLIAGQAVAGAYLRLSGIS